MVSVATDPLTPADRRWVADFFIEHWGATTMVVHGVSYEPHTLPGFVATAKGRRVGLITYRLGDDGCEIVSLDSTSPGRGVGTALVAAVVEEARRSRSARVWLVTTNDNLNALRFYQKRGFALVAVHRNAVAAARVLKPEIPLIGDDGIPIRDEIELELDLDGPDA
jgi:ribosomal protein S18 acetylase RimI-like enzyme